MLDNIKITINNWREYQPRTDLKSLAWFRLSSKIYEHPAFFNLDSDGKWFFVYILCVCASNNKSSIDYNLDYLQHFSGVSKEKIIQILQVLHRFDLIRYESVTNSLRNSTDSCPTIQYNTKERETPENPVQTSTDSLRSRDESSGLFPESPGSSLQGNIDSIIGYLNEKLKTNFSSNSKDTIKLLTTIFKTHKGLEVEMFYDVIDLKYKEWFKDVKMRKYLTPRTLFAYANFVKYAQQLQLQGDM